MIPIFDWASFAEISIAMTSWKCFLFSPKKFSVNRKDWLQNSSWYPWKALKTDRLLKRSHLQQKLSQNNLKMSNLLVEEQFIPPPLTTAELLVLRSHSYCAISFAYSSLLPYELCSAILQWEAHNMWQFYNIFLVIPSITVLLIFNFFHCCCRSIFCQCIGLKYWLPFHRTNLDHDHDNFILSCFPISNSILCTMTAI